MAAARKKPAPVGSQSGQKLGKTGPLKITSGRRTGGNGPDLSAIVDSMTGSSARSAGKTGGAARPAKKTPLGQAKRKPRKRSKPKPGETIIVA